MGITYGKVTPTSYSDPEVIVVNRCLKRFGAAVLPGAYLVDTYPILQYLPGYLTQLRKWHQEELILFEGQLDIVRKQMVTTSVCDGHRLGDSHDETGRRHGTTIFCQISAREPTRIPVQRQGDGVRSWCHVWRGCGNGVFERGNHHLLYALSELTHADCLCNYNHDNGGRLTPRGSIKNA